MKSFTATIPLLLAIFASTAFANLSETSSIKNERPPLQLNGQYTYKFLGIYKLLEIDLYLPESYDVQRDPTEQPISLTFTYNRSFTGEQLVKQGNEAIAAEGTDEENRRFANALTQLNAAYQNVEKGDRYRLDYLPQSGLSLFLNDQKVISITEQGFAQYYLKIWLGERDECQPIKRALLPQLDS